MATSSSIILAGVILGVVQLAAGVVLGLRIGKRLAASDASRVARLAADLQSLTKSVAGSVRRHNETIASIDERLSAESQDDPAPLTNMVVGVLGEILAANRMLHDELSEAEQALEEQAAELAERRRQSLTDPLTGVPNRRSLDDRLRDHVDAWRRHATPLSVLILDIDHFKNFNDTHGHLAGDDVLIAFSQTLSGALRRYDLVARYGGEEFVVLLPHTTLEEATSAVRKIRSAINDLSVDVDGEPVQVTASGGIASIRGHESGDAVLKRADEALYAAKQNGRDRVYRHDGRQIAELDASDSLNQDVDLLDPTEESLREACDDLREGFDRFLSEAEPAAAAPSKSP